MLCVCVCIYIDIYTCTHTRKYIHTYTHTHTHVHTQNETMEMTDSASKSQVSFRYWLPFTTVPLCVNVYVNSYAQKRTERACECERDTSCVCITPFNVYSLFVYVYHSVNPYVCTTAYLFPLYLANASGRLSTTTTSPSAILFCCASLSPPCPTTAFAPSDPALAESGCCL